MCELKMYTAVQMCLQELHRPTFNRVAICYSEFKRCSFNASLNFSLNFGQNIFLYPHIWKSGWYNFFWLSSHNVTVTAFMFTVLHIAASS